MKYIIYFFCAIILSSCAKLPIETLSLTDAISNEGKRMHELNLSFLNKMFNEKRDKIDAFIKDEYTPHFLKEFKKEIPEGVEVDYEKEFENMMQRIVPKISYRRDMMQSALESQRIKLVTKLNSDYKLYEEASNDLRKLMESAIKVNEERNKAFEQVKGLTNNTIDLNKIETELDKFITNTGDVSANINDLNSTFNSLINK